MGREPICLQIKIYIQANMRMAYQMELGNTNGNRALHIQVNLSTVQNKVKVNGKKMNLKLILINFKVSI